MESVESVAETETEPVEMLRLDEAVGDRPLGFGPEAEAVALEWFGEGPAALLVTALGPDGREARLYRPLPTPDGFPPRFDSGTVVEALAGLRHVCPLPGGRASRFDLLAMAPEGLVLLRNEGEPSAPRFGAAVALGPGPDLGLGPGRVAQMVATDWDGDGLVDLLVGFDDLEGYWPDDAEVPRAQQVGFNQAAGHPGYDPQGHWRGRPPRGKVAWLRNVGGPGEPQFAEPESIDAEALLELAHRPAPLVVSWGGRGASELLVADARGRVRLFRNFGGQRPPVLMEPRLLRVAGEPLVLPEERIALVAADLDGDRRDELIFGTADGRVFAIHAGGARDAARPPVALHQDGSDLWVGGGAVVTAADLDADGDIDLIVGDAAGRLLVVEDLGGPGDHRYAPPVPLDALGLPFRLDPAPDGRLDGPAAPGLGFACPALLDWSANGRLDLLLGGAGGEVFFLRNNGSATQPRFDRPEPLRFDRNALIGPPRVRPAAADWQGRGELDLLTLDLQGFLVRYPRVDRLDVDPPTLLVDRLGRAIRLDAAFGQAGRCALWAGPWTGGDRPDLLVGLPRASRHVVAAACGLAVESLDTLPTVLLLENRGPRGLIPRPVHLADGRPLVVGNAGCSPVGVDWSGAGRLDLLIGSDDGRVRLYRRDDLRW